MKAITMRHNTLLPFLPFFAAVSFTALTFSPPAQAQSPTLLPVQGHLSDTAGVPIDGTRDLVLTIYDDAAGGTAVHTETFTAHPIDEGDFVVYLGDSISLDLSMFRDDDNLWLEVTVAGETITPRLQLATAPYAGYASYCGDADTLEGNSASSFASSSHSHLWSDIMSVPADLADGDDDALATLGASCATGQVASWDGAQWVCGPVAFDAVAWPTGFSFLTVEPCPSGFTAFESGYVKLSDTPSLTPAPRSLVAPSHYHGLGNLTVQSAGNHSHSYGDYHYHDTGLQPSYATAGGDDVGQRINTGRTTSNSGAHTHPLGGTVGASGTGVDGDVDQPVAGDLEHVALRLCVKS